MIPRFQDLMVPMLVELADEEDHSHRDLITALARKFSVTEEEQRQVLGNGQTVFENRVYWAKVHLGNRGLVDTPRKGFAKISNRGRAELTKLPRDSNQQPQEPLHEASTAHAPGSIPSVLVEVEQLESQTPEEQIEAIWQSLQDQIAEELLAQVKAASPQFFERLVVDVLVAMGYGGSWADAKESVVGRSGDGGIDGIIKEDKLGLDTIHVQAKRWENVVREPEIRAFAGSLDGVRARKGVFITTSTFTQAAYEYVGKIEKRIVLIDGKGFVRLMLEHGVGVTTVHTYELRRIDSDYFEEQ